VEGRDGKGVGALGRGRSSLCCGKGEFPSARSSLGIKSSRSSTTESYPVKGERGELLGNGGGEIALGPTNGTKQCKGEGRINEQEGGT